MTLEVWLFVLHNLCAMNMNCLPLTLSLGKCATARDQYPHDLLKRDPGQVRNHVGSWV